MDEMNGTGEKKVMPYEDLLNHGLKVEFFGGKLGNGDDSLYAMIKVGDVGYYAGHQPGAMEVMPTVEYAYHCVTEKAGQLVGQLVSFALQQRSTKQEA